MIKYGTSAYLKTICLSQRASDTEIKKRILPSEGGYDFHKRLRVLAGSLMTGQTTLEEAQAEAALIVQKPERDSARAALNALMIWRGNNPGEIIPGSVVAYSHNSEEFSVKFSPDFMLVNRSGRTAYHIWNTVRPPLIEREALGALTLFADKAAEIKNNPSDLAILYLARQHSFFLSQASREHINIGAQRADRVAEAIVRIRAEVGRVDRTGRSTPTFPPSPDL